MKRQLVAAAAFITAIMGQGGGYGGSPDPPPAAERRPLPRECRKARQAVEFYRTKHVEWNRRLGRARLAVGRERLAGCRRARELAELARARVRADAALAHRLNAHPTRAIAWVFGPYAAQALAVSSCETGGTFDVNATNGQYLGLFQMGEYARARYGHGPTALEQAIAARAYFVESGRTWGPWSCKP